MAEGSASSATNPLYGTTDKDVEQQGEFQFSEGLTTAEALKLQAIHGKNEMPDKSTPAIIIYLNLLVEPMPLMIWVAAIIEAAIGNYVDMAILLFILFANATISFIETMNANDAIKALKKSFTKDVVSVYRDEKWQMISIVDLVPGDLIQLNLGEVVPADCRLNHGEIECDESALTGESLAVPKHRGDEVKMGCAVQRGESVGTVEKIGINTSMATVAALVQNERRSNLQERLIDIMIVLVCLSLTLCSVVFIYLVQYTNVVDALSFTVVLLVASIPLAIEIVTTTTLALGSHELVHHGAIVSRLSAIEEMAGMAILCSDKTGTLTMNKMVIQPETPIFEAGETQDSILRYAAMATKWETDKDTGISKPLLEGKKLDALDTLVLTSVKFDTLTSFEQLEYMPFDPIVKRTEGKILNKSNGRTFYTTKGAPHVLLQLVNNPSVTEAVEKEVHSLGLRGVRALAVATKEDGGKWRLLGLLTFLDPPREDTAKTIEQALEYGVNVKMITGDHLLIAKETARMLNMGSNIMPATGLPTLVGPKKEKPANLARDYGDMCLAADGFAGVFPEHKYLIVECLRELGYKVGMTGDGVNDAPALKIADVGIAVEGATDAAAGAAAILLTRPGLSTIINGIFISRQIFVRISNFITYRIAATLQLLFFFFIAVFAFKPSDYQPDPNPDDTAWPSFFHMPVLMLMLITLLNDGTLIAIGYDHAVPSMTPCKWNLRVLFFIGSVLAAVACLSSLLLLYALLDSWNEGSFFQVVGLGGLSYGQITTSVYLKVSVSDFLTLFSARTGDDWFWTSAPAPILIIAAAVALTTSTILAITWPASYPDGIYAVGLGYEQPYALPVYIWLYCILWWLIQVRCCLPFLSPLFLSRCCCCSAP